MNNGYFKAIVINKFCKTKEVKERIGIFKYVMKKRTIAFLKCQIMGTDFVLNIKVDEDTFHHATKDSRLSIHLSFKYEYSCFHFMPNKQPNIKEFNV